MMTTSNKADMEIGGISTSATPSENSSANSTRPDDRDSPEVAILGGLLLAVIAVAAIIGNVLVIASVYTNRKLRTVTNLFVVSLAFSDLMVGTLVLPFAVKVQVTQVWGLPDAICYIYISLDVMLCTASILNLCCISIDRYFAITRPLLCATRRSKRIASLMIGAVWILSGVIACPPILGWKEADRPTDGSKCELTKDGGYRVYSAMGSFYIPLAIMLFVYANIFIVARNSQRRWRGCSHHSTSLPPSRPASFPTSSPGVTSLVNAPFADSEGRSRTRTVRVTTRKHVRFCCCCCWYCNESQWTGTYSVSVTDQWSESQVYKSKHAIVRDVVASVSSVTTSGIRSQLSEPKDGGKSVVRDRPRLAIPKTEFLRNSKPEMTPESGNTSAAIFRPRSSPTGSYKHTGSVKKTVADQQSKKSKYTATSSSVVGLGWRRDFSAISGVPSTATGSSNDVGRRSRPQHKALCGSFDRELRHSDSAFSYLAGRRNADSADSAGRTAWHITSGPVDGKSSGREKPEVGTADGNGTWTNRCVGSRSFSACALRRGKAAEVEDINNAVLDWPRPRTASSRARTGTASELSSSNHGNADDLRSATDDVTPTARQTYGSLTDVTMTSRRPGTPRSASADVTMESRPTYGSLNDMAMTSLRQTSSANRRKTLSRDRRENSVVLRESKAVKTVSIVVGCFVLCWLPFFIVYIAEPFLRGGHTVNATIQRMFVWLGYFNSVINPFIYAFYNEDFRSTFWYLTIGRLCSSTRLPRGVAPLSPSNYMSRFNSSFRGQSLLVIERNGFGR